MSADDLKTKPESYWRDKLTAEQYAVVRGKGTEAPWTGVYVENHKTGTYACVACGQELFSSDSKYESGSGWPSFYDVADEGRVEFTEDTTHGMRRTEVTCSRCGAHLGHLFPDGPADKTGLRYCINSCSLDFKAPK